jgi:rhamnogalacturonan hydrolase
VLSQEWNCHHFYGDITSYAITTVAADLTAGFALTASIPIPTAPTTYFPGQTPISASLG